MTMEINLNDFVKVQLTNDAILHLKKWFQDLGIEQYFVEPKKDEQGFSEFQFWDLMQKFGSQMYNGNPKRMFADNKVVYVRKAI